MALVPTAHYSMPLLYNELYGIAVWLRDEAARWKAQGARAAECRCALSCILHCFLTLEAYINAYGAFYALFPGFLIASVLESLERLSPSNKWLVFPILCTGVSVFDPRSEPFVSFTKIKRMRDNFLVHPKPRVSEDEAIDISAREGRPSMGVRGVNVPETAVDTWADPPCNLDGAQWACDAVQRMIQELCRVTLKVRGLPKPPPLARFDKRSRLALIHGHTWRGKQQPPRRQE